MAKFDHLKGIKKDRDPNDYEGRKELHGIIHKDHFDFVKHINESTTRHLGKGWGENVIKNKKLWRRHQKLNDCRGIGKNKCVIGIGAGPSFHKNKDVLKDIVNRDGIKPWADRDFITIASNHQYKPLLEMGIIPDFVLLVDAGNDAVYDQLCKDIPKIGQNTTLITGVHANPKITKGWTNQDRGLVLYSTNAPDVKETFEKHYGRGTRHEIELGGNVLNGAWMIGTGIFNSTVYMCVGNDLSFPIKETVDEQRKAYYSDGDYTTNAKETGSGRDEASSQKQWGGFKLEKRKVWLPGEDVGSLKRYNIELELVGTSKTLWVYKCWLESTIVSQTTFPTHFHYFNCSESGILGVMARELDDSSLRKPDNWYLLDEVCFNKHTKAPMYHTAMLKDAANLFIKTKRSYKWQEPHDANYADGSVSLN